MVAVFCSTMFVDTHAQSAGQMQMQMSPYEYQRWLVKQERDFYTTQQSINQQTQPAQAVVRSLNNDIMVITRSGTSTISAADSIILNSGTSEPLLKCSGKDAAGQCMKQYLTKCAMNDWACQCKNVNPMFNECFSDAKLKSSSSNGAVTDSDCGDSVLVRRDAVKQMLVEKCTDKGMKMDDSTNTTSDASSIVYTSALVLFVSSLFSFM